MGCTSSSVKQKNSEYNATGKSTSDKKDVVNMGSRGTVPVFYPKAKEKDRFTEKGMVTDGKQLSGECMHSQVKSVQIMDEASEENGTGNDTSDKKDVVNMGSSGTVPQPASDSNGKPVFYPKAIEDRSTEKGMINDGKQLNEECMHLQVKSVQIMDEDSEENGTENDTSDKKDVVNLGSKGSSAKLVRLPDSNSDEKAIIEKDRSNQKCVDTDGNKFDNEFTDSRVKPVSRSKGRSDRNHVFQKATGKNPSDKKDGIINGSSVKPVLKSNSGRISITRKNSRKCKSDKTSVVINTNQLKQIDAHARKAPSWLKNSPEDLVNYMMSFTQDKRILVRGFFVWISENIRYDVDGFFGRAAKAPCDALSVLKEGRSVCAGYANVMEVLCQQANIPVKTISGYAKGFCHSATEPFNYSDKTNHAWNTIQLEGKWYLLDSTWGTGHLDSSHEFVKELEDFYFLTDPQDFIFTHFPYMERNVEESKKWQLLDKPICLEEFNSNVKYKPAAFKLRIKAVSHTRQYFEMKNEIQMVFKCETKEDVVLSGRLMLLDGNFWREQRNATFGVPENGSCKLFVHPPKVGMYELNIFGHKASDRKQERIPQIMEYTLKCTSVQEHYFEYPMTYGYAARENVVLHEPLRGNLRANTSVKFRLSAPYLQRIMVGDTYLEKSGNMFSGEMKTGAAGTILLAYGTLKGEYSRMWGLFEFTVY